MLNVVLVGDADNNKDLIVNILKKSFPEKNGEKMYDALLLYDRAFISVREYFAYYYVMGVEEIIDYVNSSNFGSAWEFMRNAIFDMGINVLCRFYGKDVGNNVRKEERILYKCRTAFGEDISTSNERLERKIIRYRNNHSAHFGNGYNESSIRYDDPLLALEKLRLDKKEFSKKRMDAGNSIYMITLDDYFCTKIKIIVNMLNGQIKVEV